MALTLRTDEQLDEALAELASIEGLSRQEVIRRAVLDRLRAQQHRERVGAAASESIARYGDALDRLSRT